MGILKKVASVAKKIIPKAGAPVKAAVAKVAAKVAPKAGAPVKATAKAVTKVVAKVAPKAGAPVKAVAKAAAPSVAKKVTGIVAKKAIKSVPIVGNIYNVAETAYEIKQAIKPTAGAPTKGTTAAKTTSQKKPRGINMGSKKRRGISWYKKQTALLAAKKEYHKAKGY